MFVLPSIRQFAEERLVIPSGVRGGMRYRRDVNPVTHGVFDIYDAFLNDQEARELFLVAGNQVGKTLSLIALGVYVLTELREDLLVFGPTLQVAQAVGGEMIRVMDHMGVKYERGTYNCRLENGTVLTWRGQSDAQRSQVTARIVLVTEAEKIRQKRTEEAHPIDQIRARTMSFSNGKIVFESTLTSETGVMWRGYNEAEVRYRFHHRCYECGSLFLPDVAGCFSDSYACTVCGSLLTGRRRCVSEGEFVREGEPCGRTYGIRYTAFDGLLIDPLATMCVLRDSKDINDLRRLYLQFLAEPPKIVFVAPSDPTVFIHRRGQVNPEDFWAVGVDVGSSVSHWVLLTYTPGERHIKITDFGKCRGSIKDQVNMLASIISGLNDRGVLLFDYGFNGAHLVRLWNSLEPRQRVLPVRGISERSFVIDPNTDISYGDFWRYRRMKGSGTYGIQVYTVSAKDAVFGLLYSSRLVIFANDGKDVTIKYFTDSICRSERPIEKNGLRVYELVGTSNHYFDATVYALTGLLFAGAPVDLSGLPRVEAAGVMYDGNVDDLTSGDIDIVENVKHQRRLRMKSTIDKGALI